jgi:hypothetical protein
VQAEATLCYQRLHQLVVVAVHLLVLTVLLVVLVVALAV